MKLIVNDNVVAPAATVGDLGEAIRGLRAAGDDSFAVLSMSESSFIQSVYADGGLGLEYKNNGELFGCYDELTDDRVIAAFTYFLNHDDRLRSEFNWESVKY